MTIVEKLKTASIIAGAALLVVACGEKKTETDVTVETPAAEAAPAADAMAPAADAMAPAADAAASADAAAASADSAAASADAAAAAPAAPAEPK